MKKPGYYILAKDSDTILLREVPMIIRAMSDQPVFAILEKKEESVIREILTDLTENPTTRLQDRSLRDILLDEQSALTHKTFNSGFLGLVD